MDFMTQLPKCNRMDAILVVVDQLSKLVKLAPTKTIVKIFNLAKLFFDMWVKYHGMLEFIVSDKNTKFMVGFWKHLFRKAGMKLSFSMAFHPQTNGQIERVNGVLNQYHSDYVNVNKKDWGEHHRA